MVHVYTQQKFLVVTFTIDISIEKDHFINKLLVFSVILTREKKMNKFQLKSFWHDQTCGPIKISLLRMRVALMMFHRVNITKKLLIK